MSNNQLKCQSWLYSPTDQTYSKNRNSTTLQSSQSVQTRISVESVSQVPPIQQQKEQN